MSNIPKNNISNLKKKQLSLMAVFYKNQLSLIILIILIFSPIFLLAQLEITEIMYDLEVGGDTGREWIEIHNSSNQDIDLSSYKLYEAEINHKIKSVIEGGNTILPKEGFAILVDNYEKFIEDWPNFSGLVLDSAFSLKNTGEFLALRNSDLVDIDSINYLSDWGANGDGKSLQKVGGEWIASSPTLGKVNFEDEDDNSAEEEPEETQQNSSDSSSQSSTPVFIEKNIKAQIKSLEYLPIAGADFTFEGTALGLEDNALKNAKYQWSFGDGERGNGQNILHSYFYPGEYLVVLEVISGEYSNNDRLKIKVVPSEIIISGINKDLDNNFIELYNPSNEEINLSWWRLRVDENYFTLPKNTILLPENYLKLPFNVTELLLTENYVIQLLYPNGMLAFNFLEKNNQNLEMKTTSFIEKEKIIIQKEVVKYSVEKPKENDFDNQTATIINNSNSENKSGEVEPLHIVNDNKEGNKESDGFKFPMNKWSLMLGGITLIAVAGVGYATKLDIYQEK